MDDDYSGMYNSGIYGGDSGDIDWGTQVNDLYTGAPVDTSWINQPYSEYQLNNPGYSSIPSFNTGFDPSDPAWSNTPVNQQGGFDGGMTMAPQDWTSQLPPEWLQQPQQMPQLQQGTSGGGWGDSLGSVKDTLAKLFQGNNGKLIGSGIAAYLEGRGNKQMAQQIPQVVAQQQARQSPFDAAATAIDPTSGRAQAMEAYKAALANPYGNKIVSDQVEALSKAQAIKDAAAGRRSNNATSSPALVAAQAQIAQKYLDSMAQQAGAGINPNMGGLSDLVSALKYGANGYTSPFASAAGYSLGSNYTQNNQQNIIDALSKLMSK